MRELAAVRGGVEFGHKHVVRPYDVSMTTTCLVTSGAVGLFNKITFAENKMQGAWAEGLFFFLRAHLGAPSMQQRMAKCN